uniref:Plastid lipid-associated protein/fibrillin conserved domain-containing protein n=1 Tax=Guillardia theta TaxID=55529 RepID=A0A7S4L5T4_GUITH
MAWRAVSMFAFAIASMQVSSSSSSSSSLSPPSSSSSSLAPAFLSSRVNFPSSHPLPSCSLTRFPHPVTSRFVLSSSRSRSIHLPLCAGARGGADEGQRADLELLVQHLLRSVAAGSIEETLKVAGELEMLDMVEEEEIAGRWSLIFSTQSAGEGIGGVDPTSYLYRTLFRLAPFLAGGQEDAGGRDKWLRVRNEQTIDVQQKTVENFVVIRAVPSSFPFPSLRPPSSSPQLVIRVFGELAGEQPRRLGVTFSRASIKVPFLPQLVLPLPRPRGELRTGFCHGDIRISRGGRGGIFILKRIRAARDSQ